MGRYLTPAGGSASSTARTQRHVIDANTPALAVPPWAKVLRVSGVGGGAGGANYTGEMVNYRGAGGGAGGVAHGAQLMINGEATVAITIGAGGVGAAGSSGAAGGVGGNTVITMGAKVITLGGGNGGPSEPAYGGYGGGAKFAAGAAYTNYHAGYTAIDLINRSYLVGLASGAAGGSHDVGCGGGESPYGRGGSPMTVAPGSNEPGENAVGRGAGGAGSRGTGKAGDGQPGLVILEFLEAA